MDSNGTHGFLDQNGVFTTLDDPNANDGTYALGINDLGEIAGYYVDNLGVNGLAYHGFLYNGSFTTIDDPDAIAAGGTEIYGINDLGVGMWAACLHRQKGAWDRYYVADISFTTPRRQPESYVVRIPLVAIEFSSYAMRAMTAATPNIVGINAA